jgi:hypothetical protein
MLKVVTDDRPTEMLMAALSGREVSLWLHRIPKGVSPSEVAGFVGLPWRDVFVSESNNELLTALTQVDEPDLVRCRGYVQPIRTDPTLLSLPPRSLPVYILDEPGLSESEFDRTARRMAMLRGLRRSGVRQLVIVSNEDATPPPELAGMIDSQFRPFVTLVTATESGELAVQAWAGGDSSRPTVQHIRQSPSDFLRAVISEYAKVYPSTATVVRFRRLDGSTCLLDLTAADDAERPILSFYDLIQERDLAAVPPENLTEDEFIGFFEGRQDSWRPYASGVPWLRDQSVPTKLKRLFGRLNSVGSPENKIAYIASEPGAGGTTLARAIAIEAARAGYPTLVAKPIPFAPDPLPVIRYLTRAHQAFDASEKGSMREGNERMLYETPWMVVFDRLHFDRREGDLRHFLNELTKAGRPAILLAVTGPTKPLEFYDSIAQEIGSPSHLLDSTSAEELGRHLNIYLRVYNKARPAAAWSQFHRQHGVGQMRAVAAFWIALSFWLRASRDLTGSIQDWIYNAFQEHAQSDAVRCGLVEIAALSSERLPMNEGLLPPSDNQWPLGLRLEDERKNLAALGLMSVKADGERYWGLAHDILGRLLLNALFYDSVTRTALGFGDARDPEHLRFLALKRLAVRGAMAETRHRALAEQFATTIFKIDPDHGARAFASSWREVLAALDEMPKLLRDTSRVFRHHTAISRRRISTLDERIYGVSLQDRVRLLERAIEDIRYALTSINRLPGDEPDLNLYNSLANAYLNLADVVASAPEGRERAAELRRLANEATHRAYSENPTSPWVVETHIKNLLSVARSEPERAVTAALEALLAVYDAIRTSDADLRAAQLGQLGDDALSILFANAAPASGVGAFTSPLDVLVATWRILSSAGVTALDETLAKLPPDAGEMALEILASPAGRGDMHVLKLQYGILSAVRPFNFSLRLGLVENLQATDGRLSPQLRLEYALLLYQVGRAREGDGAFRKLRKIWRENEYFVRVLDPLNWLREGESDKLRTVQAYVSSDQGYRSQALVTEFGNILVPFRPEEFDVRGMRPGAPFRAHVSFGYNGPFLRPTTAGPGPGSRRG